MKLKLLSKSIVRNDAQIHFSGPLRKEVHVASEASGPFPKLFPSLLFLTTNTDHISGYVYAGIRGRLCGNGAETQPRIKHKGQQETRSLQVCNRGCSFTSKCVL